MPNYICYLFSTTMLLLRQEAEGAFTPSITTRHQYQGRKAFALRWVNDKVVTYMPEIAPKDESPRLLAMEHAVDCATGLAECDIEDEEAFINERLALSEKCTLFSDYEQEIELCDEQIAAYDTVRRAIELRRELAWLTLEIEDNKFIKQQKKRQGAVGSVGHWYNDYLFFHH